MNFSAGYIKVQAVLSLTLEKLALVGAIKTDPQVTPPDHSGCLFEYYLSFCISMASWQLYLLHVLTNVKQNWTLLFALEYLY